MSAITNRRNTDSKYVSIFADSTPDVDCSFAHEFLERPSNHYSVGVENLTLCLSSMSMFESEGGYIFRVCPIKKTVASTDKYIHAQSGQVNINGFEPHDTAAPAQALVPAVANGAQCS